MNEIVNHLWQSTIFTLIIAVTAFALRRNSPRLRYWLWLAASIKFLIPFSLIVSTGARVQLPPQTLVSSAATVAIASTYFEPVSEYSTPASSAASISLTYVMLVTAWLVGSCLLLFRWFLCWRRVHRVVSRAVPMPSPGPIPMLSSSEMPEPGVFGLFRPVILLPDGIVNRLTSQQFEAILAHELRHVRCFDNLTAAIQIIVESLFWFNPLVWWIGTKLMDERERDCDEAVLKQGNEPGDYARGIVHVCETYVRPQLPCASGISGGDLKKRVRRIMTGRGSIPVSVPRKALLASAGIAIVSVPFVIGVMRTQNAPATSGRAFEVASVKINKSGDQRYGLRYLPGGRLSAQNVPIGFLILSAYDLSFQRIAPSPAVVKAFDLRYDIEAAAAPGVLPPDSTPKELNQKVRLMLQSLLADRFKVAVRRVLREQPVYALVVAKGGPKLKRATRQERDCPVEPDGPTQTSCHMVLGGVGRGMQAAAADMADFTRSLSNFSDRPIIDKTGLEGLHTFEIPGWVDIRNIPRRPAETDAQRAEEAALADPSRPTLFAVLETLGLRLEAQNAPIETYVIDNIEPPSEN